jgi:hypothetical protein
MVVRDRMVLAGVIGLAGGLVGARSLASVLYGVNRTFARPAQA